MKPKMVLVPLDGSRLAEEALAPAIGFAREGARLVLLRAAEAHATPFTDPTGAQIAAVQEAELYLLSVVERLRRVGVTNVVRSVWYGGPVDGIADAARLRHIDLIVMSTHGRSGLGRLLLGSIAEGVVRATSTPMLLLRPGKSSRLEDEGRREAAHV